MKILHVFDHSIPLHSGYTFRSRAILNQQRALGWETYHITSSKHTEAAKCEHLEEDVDGYHFYRTPLSVGAFVNLPVLNQAIVIHDLAERLAQVIPVVKPDIIHAHSPVLNGLAAAKVARQYKLPLVYEIRAFWEDAAVDHGTCKEWGLRYRLTRALETRAIKKATAVTTICDGLKEDIVSRGIPRSKVTVIPNAVDPDRFSMNHEPNLKLKQKLGMEGRTVIGFIGSFYAYEGLSLLIESMSKIIGSIKDVSLLLVGGGPEEEQLKNLVKQLKLEDRVLFAGRVPHQEVHDYYSLVDVFVYPRLSMRLTELVTPLKPLEAMAQGKLVLASDVGGHKELIAPGNNGELFEAGSSDALANAAVGLLSSKEKWDSLKASGRKYVEEERCWKRSVSHYKDVYASVLKNSAYDS